MKRFMSKKSIQKIVILIVIVLSFNFIMPTYSRADFGGVLMGPIIDLITGLGDAILSALQFFMYDGTINVTSLAGGAISGALTIINPFDSFLLMRSNDEFDQILAKYDMNASGAADITIDSGEFDKGWFGWLGSWAAKDYGVPVIKYTPEKIFGNQVPALDANFINPKDWSDETNGAEMNEHSVTQMLHNTIASWYVALRNLALVALLSVLLYVGIRMVISSSATDKSKYKEMLFNWFVAMCLLFFLHYIMSFILSLTEMITEGLAGVAEVNVQVLDSDNGNFTFKTDLTGLTRLQIQYADLGARLIYMIFYLALVIYTVMFTWTYIKRAITMAFLTLMAPLIAITYPIDKISDGKAQAFGIWFREFVFNALLQPFHFIIYTVFLGAASDIVVKNPIYAILFLAFIIPAEKLLRKMFGFEKSATAGGMSTALGMFGGAAAFKMLSGALNRSGKGGKGHSNPTGGGERRTPRTIEDRSNPEGYSAFAQNRSGNTRANQIPSRTANNQSQTRTPQQEMLDAYDENFGTNNWDPQERDAMAREANTGQGGMEYSREEYEQILRDSGYDEDQIQNEIANDPRYANVPEQEPTSLSESTSMQEPTNNTPRVANPSIARRTLNGVRALGRATFNGRNLRRAAGFVGRAAVRTVTTGTGLAIGLGMGIAGDDLEDVLTFGAAGATLGNRALGDVALNGVSGVRNVAGNVSRTFQEGYYGVNTAAVRRQTREFTRDENRRNYFSAEFAADDGQRVTGRKLDGLMNRAAYYNNSGITDNSAIKKSLKLEDSIKKDMENIDIGEEDKTRMAREQSATIAKIADKVDDKKLMTDEKYAQGLEQNFVRGLQHSNPSMSEKDLKDQSQHMMKLLKKYKKID